MIQRFAVDTEKQNEYNSKVIDEDALISILILLDKTVIQVYFTAGPPVYFTCIRMRDCRGDF